MEKIKQIQISAKCRKREFFAKSFFSKVISLALLFMVAMLGACSTIKGTASYGYDKGKEFVAPRGGRADFDLAEGIRFKKRAGIYTGEIVTRIHPNINLEQKPTALFVPLGLVQDSRDHYAISQGVSRLIWESLLAESTFATLEYGQVGVPYSLEQMLPYAEQKGAEFLVGGLIQQYYDGGTTGDSRFAMQLQIYHVPTGALIWSINHSGVLPYKSDGDFALFRVQSRMPVNPMATLITAVSDEIALLLHYWTEPKEMKRREMMEDSYRNRTAPSAF